MSKWSNSDFANIFYDMIPFSMSEACATGMHGAFAQYVTTVRGADRVSTISESVAEDLRGFLVAVHNQGLNPPEVRSHLFRLTPTKFRKRSLNRINPESPLSRCSCGALRLKH